MIITTGAYPISSRCLIKQGNPFGFLAVVLRYYLKEFDRFFFQYLRVLTFSGYPKRKAAIRCVQPVFKLRTIVVTEILRFPVCAATKVVQCYKLLINRQSPARCRQKVSALRVCAPRNFCVIVNDIHAHSLRGPVPDYGRLFSLAVKPVQVVHIYFATALHNPQGKRLQNALQHFFQRQSLAVLIKKIIASYVNIRQIDGRCASSRAKTYEGCIEFRVEARPLQAISNNFFDAAHTG